MTRSPGPAERGPGAARRPAQWQGTPVLIVDNDDSFTWNLVQLLGSLGAVVEVVRHGAVRPRVSPAGPTTVRVLQRNHSDRTWQPEDGGRCRQRFSVQGPVEPEQRGVHARGGLRAPPGP